MCQVSVYCWPPGVSKLSQVLAKYAYSTRRRRAPNLFNCSACNVLTAHHSCSCATAALLTTAASRSDWYTCFAALPIAQGKHQGHSMRPCFWKRHNAMKKALSATQTTPPAAVEGLRPSNKGPETVPVYKVLAEVAGVNRPHQTNVPWNGMLGPIPPHLCPWPQYTIDS